MKKALKLAGLYVIYVGGIMLMAKGFGTSAMEILNEEDESIDSKEEEQEENSDESVTE